MRFEWLRKASFYCFYCFLNDKLPKGSISLKWLLVHFTFDLISGEDLRLWPVKSVS